MVSIGGEALREIVNQTETTEENAKRLSELFKELVESAQSVMSPITMINQLWKIHISSEVGQGTTTEVILPVTDVGCQS